MTGFPDVRHGPLALSDIADLREYERVRDRIRSQVIELKKLRRVSLGDIVTVVFENRETIRFQIQEMARAEKMVSDDAVQAELDTYNPLIPAAGELSATLFLELRSEEELRRWLPSLVGIERSVELRLGADGSEVLQCLPEEAHAAQLTRDDVTASVHYIRWTLDAEQIRRFADGPVGLAVRHPSYDASAELSEPTRRSLLSDLQPD